MPNKDAPPDPSMQFQEWVTQWERAVDEFSNRMMGTDEFSRSLNQMQSLQLEFQRNFGDFMSKQLANLNMPSRDDVLMLSEDLRSIDRRLAHVERSLDKLLQKDGTKRPLRQGPARTRKPPKQEAES